LEITDQLTEIWHTIALLKIEYLIKTSSNYYNF